MRKLYITIEDIYIKGGIDQLSDLVRSIDVSLQTIAQNTENLTHYLMKYSSSNRGAQFEKAMDTTMNLRKELYNVSRDINDLQNQIVDYQNKIYRYEDMSVSAPAPNVYLVNTKPIDVDKTAMQFERSEMIAVASELKKYSEGVFYQIRSINKNKNDIARVWLDSQYNSFSDIVDEITRNVIDAIKTYEAYVIYLEEKIKELG